MPRKRTDVRGTCCYGDVRRLLPMCDGRHISTKRSQENKEELESEQFRVSEAGM